MLDSLPLPSRASDITAQLPLVRVLCRDHGRAHLGRVAAGLGEGVQRRILQSQTITVAHLREKIEGRPLPPTSLVATLTR